MNAFSVSSRRKFLKSTVAGSLSAAALANWNPIPLMAEDCSVNADNAARFEFVQINDLHVEAKPPEALAYAQANDKARWCVEEILRGPQPDFVLAIGDMIHGHRVKDFPTDLEEFQRIVEPLKGIPFYPCMGNHENYGKEGDENRERPYHEVYGADRINYFFEHQGLMFIVFNNSGSGRAVTEAGRKRNAWLRDVLEKHPQQKKILCCHIPIIPVRDEPVLAKSFGFSSYAARDAELLGLVDEHASTIVAVLSGHLHLTGFQLRNGVHHISICGPASYPCDIARFAVYDDKIEMKVCQLPEEFLTSRPSIHGVPRFPSNFTDSKHETAETYQAGRADERQLTIPLSCVQFAAVVPRTRAGRRLVCRNDSDLLC